VKTLILGLGNDILSDDSCGLVIARKLFEKIRSANVEHLGASYAGWRLIDLLKGFDKAVIIDSIVSADVKPGECVKIDPGHITSAHLANSHGLGLFEALEMSRSLGGKMPERISIYAVGVRNPYEFGEKLACDIEARIPYIIDEIIKEEKFDA
jgi:hydrogenase maturation protease